MGKKVLIFLIAALVIEGIAFSQDKQTGTLSGVVRSPDGSPLSGVIVLLRSPVLDLPEIEAVTNVSGMYGFLGLSPGTYKLMFIFAGLQHVEQSGIVISAGRSVSLDMYLPLRAKDETVIVEGDLPKELLSYDAISEICLTLYRQGLYILRLRSIFN